jgi:ferredoxin
VDIAPGVFELNDIAHVIGPGPPDLVRRAAEECPSVAITVIDEDSGKQVYP